MSTQQRDQHWNAGGTEIIELQQLNSNWPDQRQSINPQSINLTESFKDGAVMKNDCKRNPWGLE